MENMEIVKPVFLQKSLATNVNLVRRFNSNGNRYYFSLIGNDIVLLPSVTSVLKSEMPTEQFLINWMVEKGKQQANYERDTSASYGTAMHALFAEFAKNRKLKRNFDIKNFILELGLPYFFDYWIPDLKKDLLAYAQFVTDFDIEPLAIEICLMSENLRLAGGIDLVCEMTYKKKRITAIIDFKSSKKGYHPDSNIYQLELYKNIWEDNLPGIKIDRLFNWSPKDFRTPTPTYTLTDNSCKANIRILENYLFNFFAKDNWKPSNKFVFDDDLIFGQAPKNIYSISIEDYLKNLFYKENV